MKIFTYILPLLLISQSYADDIEIYRGSNSNIENQPNVLFIMDSSGSMARNASGSLVGENHPTSRMYQVKEAAKNAIQAASGINLGLARFNFSEGGPIIEPIDSIDNNRQAILDAIDNDISASGRTPITETLHEAYLYFLGAKPQYSKSTSDINTFIDSNRNNNYDSPIISECQPNHIILFSDGFPFDDRSSNTAVRNSVSALPISAINSGRAAQLETAARAIQQADNTLSDEEALAAAQNRVNDIERFCNAPSDIDGVCANELAFFMNYQSTQDESMQPIRVHTVGGFSTGARETLEDIAWASSGDSFFANNAADIAVHFRSLLINIEKRGRTFSAPAVSVNSFNSLEHLDELYYSVYEPSSSATWLGNLKRYRLLDGKIVDQNDIDAVDDTGFFHDDALSFWTDKSDLEGLSDENGEQIKGDGRNVSLGGAANELDIATRKVTTYLGSNRELFSESNRVSKSNSNIDNAALNLPSDSDARDLVLDWAAGIDVNDEDFDNDRTDTRRFIEDPLHSRPVIVNYSTSETQNSDGTTDYDYDSTLFMATNSGVLHAFDTDTGEEVFAFIPEELLGNLYQYYSGNSVLDKVYGLDGPITYWHDDVNYDGQVNNADQVILYVGMRRGGNSYYALDITDRDNPKYLWQIDGGSTDFRNLGQTWSEPILTKIRYNDQIRNVLVFGGGYDEAEDNYTVRTNHSVGNAIYIIDAKTGQKIWSASRSSADLNLTEMRSSITSEVIPVDFDGDGFMEMLYAADVGGRIWRIDFDNNLGTLPQNFAQGGVIADLNGGSESNNIRFYSAPDVSYTVDDSVTAVDPSDSSQLITIGGRRFQIAIGSGYRAHPLDNRVNDTFYIINDYNVGNAPVSYVTVSESDMANYANYSTESADEKRIGTYFRLPNTGEKSLARSVTVNDNVFFTTFAPQSAESIAGCNPDVGIARLYTISPDNSISYRELAQDGIPPSPEIIFPPKNDSGDDGDSPTVCTDSMTTEECFCIENPSAKQCLPEPPSCDAFNAIALVASEVAGAVGTFCDQVQQDYWKEIEPYVDAEKATN